MLKSSEKSVSRAYIKVAEDFPGDATVRSPVQGEHPEKSPKPTTE